MKVLSSQKKPKTFKKKALACDWFIMDLMSAALNGGLDEIEQVVKGVKELHSAGGAPVKEQTIVLVSSVLTWANASKKTKKDYPNKVSEDGNIIVRDDESEDEDYENPDKVL
jgi:hypothetical protein